MNAFRRYLTWFWPTGLALALLGVAGARVAASSAWPHRATLTLGAELLALSGVLVIALGLRAQARQRASGESENFTSAN